MLKELTIKNFALIDEIKLEFGPGLTVISGETGSGKSLFAGALGVLSGERAGSDWIRLGEDEAIIEAVFESADECLEELLKSMGLWEGRQLMIRRHIQEGRSRIYANNRSITLTQLKELATYLLEGTYQHESQNLLREETHRSILDSKIDPKILTDYQAAFQIYQDLKHRREELIKKNQDRERRLDFLVYQIQEINSANLQMGEEEELKTEKTRVKYAHEFQELYQSGRNFLESESGILMQVATLLGRVEKMIPLDPGLQKILDLLQEASPPLEELARFFNEERTQEEVRTLDSIESRLYQIQQIKKKYGKDEQEIILHLEGLKKEKSILEDWESSLADLDQEMKVGVQQILGFAQTLTEERKKAAKHLQKRISQELKELSMGGLEFSIRVELPSPKDLEGCHEFGWDQIFFEISNPGEARQSISKIASGGEMSRILLAIKNAVHDKRNQTFLFDEIDSGIGGATGEVVGRKLKSIAQANQVLCITHLPQIASLGDFHFVIEKESQDRTRTGIRLLNEKQREEEIARMLGGVLITATTRAHAREMMKGSLNT